MKNNLLNLLALIIIASSNSYSQEIEINWSEPITYDSKNGYFHKFNTQNNKYTFIEWRKANQATGRGLKQLKIIALDKKTNNKISELPLLGFKENKPLKKKYKKLDYWFITVLEDVVIALWKKSEGNKTEIFGETFDSELKRTSSLVKMFEFTNKEDYEKKPYHYLVGNGKKIVLVSESAGFLGEKLNIKLKLFSKDLQSEGSFQTQLPLILTTKHRALPYSQLKLSDDNTLHFESDCTLANDNGTKKKSGLSDVTSSNYGSINVLTKKIVCKNPDLPYRDYETKVITNDGVYIYGFLGVKKNDIYKKRTKITGLIYVHLDENYDLVSKKITKFTSSDISEIFQNNPYSKDEIISHSVSEPDFFSSEYQVEKVKIEDNGDVIFACSRNHFRTEEGTSSSSSMSIARTTTTTYSTITAYNIKSDVLLFKLDNKGNLKWKTNVPRRCEYSMTFMDRGDKGHTYYFLHDDINILDKGDELIVITADEYDINNKGIPVEKKAKTIRKLQPVRVIKVNKESGEYTTSEFNINGGDGAKKTVTIDELRPMSDGLYIHSYKGMGRKKGFVGTIQVAK